MYLKVLTRPTAARKEQVLILADVLSVHFHQYNAYHEYLLALIDECEDTWLDDVGEFEGRRKVGILIVELPGHRLRYVLFDYEAYLYSNDGDKPIKSFIIARGDE